MPTTIILLYEGLEAWRRALPLRFAFRTSEVLVWSGEYFHQSICFPRWPAFECNGRDMLTSSVIPRIRRETTPSPALRYAGTGMSRHPTPLRA